MKDIIYIEKLMINTTIGVYEWEQKIKQRLILDIEMIYDNELASKKNDINFCLNYTDISNMIINYVENKCFTLLESVAEELAQLMLHHFNSSWVRIKVSKPGALLHAKNVGVIIERKKF